MNTGEFQYQLQKSVLVGACLATAFLVGLLLVGAPFMLVLGFSGVVWLMTLPYHATIAIYLGIATLNSALIIPGINGRPFWWELAAGLGWSGVIVTLALRRQMPGAAERLRTNWVLIVGLVGFFFVLLGLALYRGVGIRALSSESGSGQVGGRLYVQQLACAIFPFLLAINPLGERTLVRLFLVQCLLSATFLASDFIFSFGAGPLFDLLLFLELPNDGLNFEIQSLVFGIRRFQSLFTFTFAMLLILWMKRPFRDYTNRQGLWLWPLTITLVSVGVLSGHRQLLYTAGVTAVVLAWSQRFFSVQRLAFVVGVAAVAYFMTFSFVRELPLSAQRALSLIPGIEVDRAADEDGRATFEGRMIVRKAGWEESKKYRWIGRGFGKIMNQDPNLYRYDMSYLHVENGVFYNGTIGLLVNTGLPGTIAMFLMLGGGTMLAGRILRQIRQHGAEDDFSRFAGLQAAMWISNTVSLIFLHGDAEFALRGFAMPAALMLASDWHLRRRYQTPEAASQPVADGTGTALARLEPAGARG